MKRSPIHYTKECLITQMNHWILAIAAMTLFSVFSPDRLHLGFLLLLGIVPAFFYFLRIKANNFFVFFGLHLLPFISVMSVLFAYDSLILSLVTMAILLFHLIYSVKIKIKPTNVENPFVGPAAGVCLIAVFAFFHAHYGKVDISSYYIIALFIFLLVFFLYYFMDHYIWFVSVQKNSVDNISEKSLWIGGMKLLVAFVAITILSMLLLGDIEWLSYIASKIGAALTEILRFIIAFLNAHSNPEDALFDNIASGGGEGQMMPFAGSKTGSAWIVLEYIAIALVAIGLVWLIGYGLYLFFKMLWEGFHENKTKKVDFYFSEGDVREQIEIIQNKRLLRNIFAPKNSRDAARKVYKKYIIKHKELLVGPSDQSHLAPLTAGECCEKLDNPEAQAIYEKVRYSDQKISSADVKALKEKTK